MSSPESSAALGKRLRDDDGNGDNVGPPVLASGGRLDMPPADADDSDDEIGPMPTADDDDEVGPVLVSNGRKKKRAVLPHERLFLDHLPDSDRYWKSFMHRDVVNYVYMTKTNFLVTTSVDGHLKLWKKQESGIEFVKHYRTSLKAIVGVSASEDGTLFATISENGEGRVFDVVNFDMINIFKFTFTPKACCWIHEPGAVQPLLAVSDVGSGAIRVFDGRGDSAPVHELAKLHRAPVHLMAYSAKAGVVLSADEAGFVEYWQPREPWGTPEGPGMWTLKSTTDLFHFKKTKTLPTSITFSPSGAHFAVLALPSRAVHVFTTRTGKLSRTYDESLAAISEMQQAGTAVFALDDMDFGRRLALERELDNHESGPGGALRTANAVWDESGNFLLYPTMLGVKMVNIMTNKVARVLGKDETLRFLNLSLFQGAPAKKAVQTLAMAASANPLLQEKATRDPTLFATAYKKQRFYMFGSGKQEESRGERDVYNERPTRDELVVAAPAPEKARAAATECTLHTSMGDIHLKLFPHIAPKTVENFVTHARNGYYNGTIFHRVIKKFMVQGGDPTGTGMGGESIWGGEFEDELSPLVAFDKPFVLASANAGKNTNGSQFFITTTPTPWLEGKHTIFGKATAGLEVVKDIEGVGVDKNDKPYADVRIMSVSIE
ncbi:Peptidyl-prolyl cis-trans isomerase cyp15 [Cryptotrichosporon argae]